MDLSPIFHLSDLNTPVGQFSLVLVGDDGERMWPGGSAVIIGPQLGLTAKHVIKGMWDELSGMRDPFAGPKPLDAPFRILAIQFFPSLEEITVWTVETAVGCAYSDLSVLHLKPLNDRAIAYQFSKRLKLQASPPARDSLVAAFGFAGTRVEVVSREPKLILSWGINPATTQGPVLNVFQELRDRALFNFPCFEINARFEDAMSGGPVFNDAGELCGVVCASLVPIEGVSHIAYVATLWPIFGTLIDFPLPGLTVRGPYILAELGEVGYLHIQGWEDIKARISIVRDEQGNERFIFDRHI